MIDNPDKREESEIQLKHFQENMREAEKNNIPEAEKLKEAMNTKLRESGSEYSVRLKPVAHPDFLTRRYSIKYRLDFAFTDGRELTKDDYPKLQKDLNQIGLSGLDVYGGFGVSMDGWTVNKAIDYIGNKQKKNGENPFYLTDMLNKKFEENNLDCRAVIFLFLIVTTLHTAIL